MMGRTHALSGLALYAAGSLLFDLPTGSILLGGAVCAGAAVLPDIDHPGSGISRTFGPITRSLAWVVGKVSGGHRNGTHSALGAALLAAIVFIASAVYTRDRVTLLIGCGITGVMLAAGLLTGLLDTTKGRGRKAYKERWHGYVSILVCALLATGLGVGCYMYGRTAGTVLIGGILVLVLAAAIRPLNIKGLWDDLAPIPVTFLLLWSHTDLSVVPYAVTAGVIIHILGDMITLGGCPLGWPWSQTMRGPRWFKTGSAVEYRLVAPLLCLVLAGAIAAYAVPALTTHA